MSDFAREPFEKISVADARDLILGRRMRGFAYASSRVDVFPRPTRIGKLLRRWRFEVAAIGFGATWLALPRGSVLGIVLLAAAVAAGRLALDVRRGRGR